MNPTLVWSANCAISWNVGTDQETTFAITDTILYFLVVTLWIEDNAKLLQQISNGYFCGKNPLQNYIHRQVTNTWIM